MQELQGGMVEQAVAGNWGPHNSGGQLQYPIPGQRMSGEQLQPPRQHQQVGTETRNWTPYYGGGQQLQHRALQETELGAMQEPEEEEMDGVLSPRYLQFTEEEVLSQRLGTQAASNGNEVPHSDGGQQLRHRALEEIERRMMQEPEEEAMAGVLSPQFTEEEVQLRVLEMEAAVNGNQVPHSGGGQQLLQQGVTDVAMLSEDLLALVQEQSVETLDEIFK